MRISDDTRFPHPVLSTESGDFGESKFDVSFTCEESAGTGKVKLQYAVELDQPEILRLVEEGSASIGAFVRCQDTYFSSLMPMAWPHGEIVFQDGALLYRVVVRPVIWLTKILVDWKPAGMVDEFSDSISLMEGAIVAFGRESILNVGRAKLAPFESIFIVRLLDAAHPDTMAVDLVGDKIAILAGKNAFKIISELRTNHTTRNAALGAVYLPAVMETLDQLRSGTTAFEGRRWFTPFQARCDRFGVDMNNPRLVEDAQRLLDQPIAKLDGLVDAING